jgi:hypothetical protein
MSESTPALRRRNGARLWRAIIKAVGLAVVAGLLGLFAASVPMRARQLATVVTEGETVLFPGAPAMAAVYTSRLGPREFEALAAWGISPGLYAAYFLGLEIGLALACAAVGLFIFWRRPEGWLTVWVSLVLVLVGTTATSPVIYSLTMTWPGWEAFPPGVGLLGMASFLHILYLAPDGRFVPPWTLPLAAGFSGGAVALFLYVLGDARDLTFFGVFLIGIVAWLILSAVGALGQVHRYRHVSGPVERQQIKWVALGLAAVTLGILVNFALFYTATQASGSARVLHNLARTPLVSLCLLSLPMSLAFSILRYRLWDIDLIIRRTLIYASLTAALAVVYLGSVVVLQAGVGGLGGERQSEMVTVLSTLAIAALFIPARRRVQDVIDRRFFRRKYDAAQVLEAFGATLRDETDQARLSEGLVGVVDQAMQPGWASLWLKPPGPNPSPAARLTGKRLPPDAGTRK